MSRKFSLHQNTFGVLEQGPIITSFICLARSALNPWFAVISWKIQRFDRRSAYRTFLQSRSAISPMTRSSMLRSMTTYSPMVRPSMRRHSMLRPLLCLYKPNSTVKIAQTQSQILSQSTISSKVFQIFSVRPASGGLLTVKKIIS
jgi:hypothetical protein